MTAPSPAPGSAGKVLVTGAAGFIGGYLVSELLARGYQVIGLDNLSKYGEARQGRAKHPAYEFVRGDAADVGLVTDLVSDCDQLVAGAAMVGGIAYFHSYPYDLLAANERITAAACDAAIAARRAGRLAKVTFISSSMVYEQAAAWPSAEGDELRMPPPATAYGFQKLAVEYFARAAWDQYRLPFTIVRPFNCVGVGETRSLRQPGGLAGAGTGTVRLAMSHVVPDLVYRTLIGQNPVHILGAGDQVRHYTYGGDLARGIVAAIEHPAAVGQDFNLATDRGTTVRELATLIWHKINGPDSPPRFVPDPPYPDDVRCRIPDTAKAREMLGFAATTSLETMLDEVIAWVRDAIAAGLM